MNELEYRASWACAFCGDSLDAPDGLCDCDDAWEERTGGEETS